MTDQANGLSALAKRTLALMAIASFVVWAIAAVLAIRQVGHPFPGFRYDPHLVVSAKNDRGWNGPMQGLASYDRIVRVNGRTIQAVQEFDRLIRSLPVGTLVSYEVQRGSQTTRIAIRTQRLEPHDFLRTFLPILAIGLLYLLIGTVSFYCKPASPAAQAHLLLDLCLGLFLTLGIDTDTTHVLSRLYPLTAFAIGSTLIHLALSFPSPAPLIRRRSWLLLIPYLALPVIWSGALDRSVPGYRLFAFWTGVGFLVWMGSLIVSTLRPRSGIERAQTVTVLLGSAIGYLPILSIYNLPILMGHSHVSYLLLNLALLFTVAFPLSIAYAIIKHQLFSIELVIRRTITYAVVTALLTVAYVVVIEGAQFILGGASPLGNALATIVVALLFAPLRDRAKAIVNRLFFRTGYDFQAVVTEFGSQAQETRDSAQLLRTFLKTLEEALHPEFLAVLIRPEGTRELVLTESLGLAAAMHLTVPMAHPVIQHAVSIRRPTPSEPEGFETLGQPLCLPLIAKEELIGTVLIGPRKSGQDYRSIDHLLLAHLGQQLSVWLKNAQLFGELKRHAAELQDLVGLYEKANQQAMTDPMTGLFNRRAFRDHLLHDFTHSRRYQRPHSVILFDIDHFKGFNDTFGHAVGDQVICQVAEVLKGAVRTSDSTGRWGGEEFIVTLPETDAEGARTVAERIRCRVAETPLLDVEGRPLRPITVSLGIATVEPQDDVETLVERADRALYAAKTKGRNQVQVLA